MFRQRPYLRKGGHLNLEKSSSRSFPGFHFEIPKTILSNVICHRKKKRILKTKPSLKLDLIFHLKDSNL
ncbi:hypothetical protein DLM75_23435 [Leptospira stimsonii]|uniref:Uncharacterized protein n=1 Tax=Leptospira stimsonii TaxID=2202203 RepID=A0A396YLK2_9LEPT|nr:hypothetical protein DLM75_23435 [Leptospira stimsonii]